MCLDNILDNGGQNKNVEYLEFMSGKIEMSD